MPGAFDDLVPTTATRPPMVISGGAKLPPPQTAAQAERDALSVTRSRQEIEKNPIDIATAEVTLEEKRRKLAQGPQADATEGERKAAAFLMRAVGANHSYESRTGTTEADKVPGIGPRSMVGQVLANNFPNALNSLPSSVGNSPERQIADSAQDEFIAASLRQDSGAAIPDSELERQRRIYFPMPGDGPEAMQQKREARLRAIRGLVQSGGRSVSAADKEAAEKYLASVGDTGAAPPAPPGDTPTPPPTNAKDVAEYAADKRLRGGMNSAEAVLTADQDQAFHQFLLGKPDATAIRAYLKDLGVNAGPGDNAEEVAKFYRDGNTSYGGVAPAMLTPEQNARVEENLANGQTSSPFAMGAARTVTSGFLDEAGAGVDAATSALAGQGSFKDLYADYLATNRETIRRSGEENPIATGAGMLVGGAAIPFGAGARTPAEIARVSGVMGALYGVGDGTTAGGRAAGGAIGGALGLAGGYGLGAASPYVGKGIASAYDKVFAARGANAAARNAGSDLVNAGQAEGVAVNRAMVDPTTEQAITRSQASLFGGGKVTRGMESVYDDIDRGVTRLGEGGTAMEPSVAGDTVRTAAERYIQQSGAVARRQYDKAERLAGDLKVAPLEAGQSVGRIITKLQETPESNAAEIAFLQKLENDFGKNLSVGALRRVRTQLRQRISKGELTFGEAEADVLDVMNAASRDIENGLTAAGKADAAKAFKSADAAYRQRMEYITGEVQKLIGKRGQQVTPEATFQRFQAMGTAKGDEAGLGRMMARMEPEEAADVRATLASSLGKGRNGEFSGAYLVSNAEKLPPKAREHIFGKDGAESLDRLVTLAKAANRVKAQFNNSKTGIARAGDMYRTAVMAVTGLGAGSSLGNALTGVAATAASGAAFAVRDILSARALMSTNLTKWLARTPTTAADVEKHIGQLSVVAAREPSIANEVLNLQSRLADAFVSAPTRLAADERDGRANPVDGRKRNGQNNGGAKPASSQQAPQLIGAPM